MVARLHVGPPALTLLGLTAGTRDRIRTAVHNAGLPGRPRTSCSTCKRLNVLQGSAARRLDERHGFTLESEDPVDVFTTRFAT
ncbi:hypothetical protein ACPPVO_35270 [Dactylosporangium sp. McL0621]|uniref:hypothetical protein n=1 Tax=Dactylosporangium sp. McL0621 TaxID=3415678 RepID=UPI003CF35421